ncbi:hypothetical protein ILYODFUR_019447 [Ilyodon furcidens]|uniref:Uncharacterized protein n=1 Tax=Ilyodon furcidens TaxID=33524 RepID=A0ABV0V4D3_9TELE
MIRRQHSLKKLTLYLKKLICEHPPKTCHNLYILFKNKDIQPVVLIMKKDQRKCIIHPSINLRFSTHRGSANKSNCNPYIPLSGNPLQSINWDLQGFLGQNGYVVPSAKSWSASRLPPNETCPPKVSSQGGILFRCHNAYLAGDEAPVCLSIS